MKKQYLNSYGLTLRQLEVLQCLAEGLEKQDLANKLGVSIGAINTHLYSIYKRLGVDNKVSAVVKTLQVGLIDFPPLSFNTVVKEPCQNCIKWVKLLDQKDTNFKEIDEYLEIIGKFYGNGKLDAIHQRITAEIARTQLRANIMRAGVTSKVVYDMDLTQLLSVRARQIRSKITN